MVKNRAKIAKTAFCVWKIAYLLYKLYINCYNLNVRTSDFLHLETEYEKALKTNATPFCEYPRPQLKRSSYLSLNGLWRFFVQSKKGENLYGGKILVPFVPESRISGVFKNINKTDKLIYEREFLLENEFLSDRVVIHFGACDQYATVFINGVKVGKNVGILPFSFDITSVIKVGVNTIKVVASDPLNKALPYGKQSSRRGGMWYTPISGIWQSVWVESVPENYIEKIKITPDLNGINLTVVGGVHQKTLVFNGNRYEFFGDSFRLNVENPVLWSPENPHLYQFELISGKDKISSYFGLRTVSIVQKGERKYIELNGKPYFFNGVLDQGYFSDGIYLPATAQGFIDDILAMKKCGFNTLRKHIKIEPNLFYYFCDKYGMLVFQDMVNSGKYNFIIDTALPTVFLKKGIRHRASKARKKHFINTCIGTVDNLYNHPSIVYYTIFNEGWGQFDEKGNYSLIKERDNTRIVDTTSGWFKSKYTQVESDHVYFKKIKCRRKLKKPWVLSEFGGYSYKIKEHSFNQKKTYGYKFFSDAKAFEDALLDLYRNQILPCAKAGLNGAILTQLSDVEDETNGLLSYDRKVLKLNATRLFELNKKIEKAFNDSIEY